jgi:hypothetical protein
MAFCTNCGAAVTGAFCQQCGQPAAASTAPAPPPAAAVPFPPAAVAPASRKTSPLVWVLVVLLGLVVLAGVGILGTGYFVYRTAKRAGFDPQEMKRNPALAVSKIIAAVNPNLEVLNVDEGKGTITVREKSSGKVVSLNFDDVKQGRIVIGEESEGKTSKFEIGASADKIPSWVPAYPGARIEGHFTASTAEGQTGSFSYKTSDAPAKVIDFYKDALSGAGFQITATATTGESQMLAAEDAGSGRNVVVTIAGGSANVVFGVKKKE